MFSRMMTPRSTGDCWKSVKKLKDALKTAEAVVIGAGAGLSTSAGFTYTGGRFKEHFADFEMKYGLGGLFGSLIQFNTEGLDFVMTAMFVLWSNG